ncbi:MAG: glycosyltransferase family 4 protein [Chloroflexota bacterium]|nr:glycosyltransferase family 4 protein [Chloroflexota bacterium]
MHILFLTQVLPFPVDAGPKIRAYYTLRYLCQHHRVTLLSFIRLGDPAEAVEHLRTFCSAVYTVPMERSRFRDGWHLIRSLATGTPFLIARDWVPEMAARVRKLARYDLPFDVIHADQLWMAPYALLARQRAMNGRSPAMILDQHNAVFQIPARLAQRETNPIKRALLALEGRKLARYEKQICRKFDHVVWVTEEDRAALEAQAINAPLTTSTNRRQSMLDGRGSSVIPICTDPDEQQVIQRQPDAHRITFLGGLHWPPNAEGILWFAQEVWPHIAAQVPHTRLTIIGKNPPNGLVEMSGSHSPIEVTGYVDDATSYLSESAVFIVPLHAGGGMRVKILDAWSWGLPVVSTEVGAEGICTRDGENILLADTSEAFARAVVRVLREPELAIRLAYSGRSTLASRYDWRKVYGAWDKVYEQALGCQAAVPSEQPVFYR